MKPKLSKELQKKWFEMTDNNEHRQVRQEIAEYLTQNVHPSFIMYAKLFAVMQDYIEKQQIPVEYQKVECDTTDAMLKELYDYYDCKMLVVQINRCL